ncbi:MAG: ABC transporter substrate-binding protein [Alphaproteobacteria bacterium]|nr:ABC transporter substrate-binding protein [Alphaproteobacteria bacterium]
MTLRHHTARFFSICLVGAVALCAQGALVPSAWAQPLRVGVAGAPKTLNPALAADAAGARLLQLTHPALLQWDAQFQPQGLVAERCTVATPTRVACTLPSDKMFTSGTPLTATAVAGWLQQVQANARSPLAGGWRDVSITAPTATTLEFALPAPNLGFISTLVETPLADPAAPSFGAGPYVATHLEATGVVALTPSPTQALPTLQFIPLADATTRVLKLQQGELEVLVHDLPPTLVRYAQAQAASRGWQVQAVPSSSYSYLALNFRNPVLAEASVREALSLGLNRPLLRKALLNNLAQPATSLLPPGHPALWAAPEDPFDPFTAAGLLDDTQLPDGRTLLLGPDGTRLTLTLLTSTEAFSQRLAQAIQAAWAELGVQVNLQSAEWATFHSRVQQGQFDVALLTWTGLQQPTFYHKVFNRTQTPPIGLNRGAVADASLDDLTARLLAAPDAAALTAVAQQVQRRVASVRPYLPLWRRDHVLVLGPAVRGCTMGLSGDYRGLLACRSATR